MQHQPLTLYTANPAAKLLVAILNESNNRIIYDELVEAQDAAIDAGEPPMALPLIWIAMLNVAGFIVDPATGEIEDGPADDVLRHVRQGRGIAYRYPMPAEGLQLAEAAV